LQHVFPDAQHALFMQLFDAHSPLDAHVSPFCFLAWVVVVPADEHWPE
jgi:hypothetical protein